MIFAKIDYINLLPFDVFIKKYIKNSQIKAVINYKKTYPSKINKLLYQRKVNAGFISSIASKNQKSLDIGIVAKGEVQSVLAIKGEYEKDYESSTSNVLCKILKVEGRVIIGDKALHYYHNHSHSEFIDLAAAWKEKYNLPFVFARLCFNSNKEYLSKIAKEFTKTKVKIPRYILQKYSKKTKISEEHILKYLEGIHYKINIKEKKALKKFFILAQKVK